MILSLSVHYAPNQVYIVAVCCAKYRQNSLSLSAISHSHLLEEALYRLVFERDVQFSYTIV